MRKILIVIICILCIVNYCKSQSSWVKNIVDSTKNFAFVQFINSQTGYICGNNYFSPESIYVYKTTNSGNNWIKIKEEQAECNSMYFTNANTGYITLLYAVFPPVTAFWRTTNGGTSWQYIQISFGGDNLFFLNEMSGWCSGWLSISKTTDGGYGWTSVSITSQQINKILFLDINTGYYLGYDNTIFKSTNAGFNWNFIAYSSIYSSDIFFLDSLNGYIAGKLDSVTIVKSTNGGYNWIPVFQTREQLRKIKFINSNVGYVIGDTNKIYRTSDGGCNWIGQNLEPTYKFSDFSFINIYTGWVVGNKGIVMRTTNGGSTFITQSDIKIPLSFSLSQNYPNPFNPSTKIKFDIPETVKRKTLDVKLIIYNILGREIQTLVNESLKPGSYEVTFDGSNLPSGVYFYKLIAGNYVETKKMLMIK